MNRLKAVMSWVFRSSGSGPAVISFAMPFRYALTDQDPDVGAGSFASMVTLCVSVMVFAEAIRNEGLKNQRIPGILIGLVGMGGRIPVDGRGD